MPIRLAGDAGRFRRLDILVRRTTGVFRDLTAQPTKPRIAMCSTEYSKKKHNEWLLPFFRGQNPSSGLAATFSPDDRGEGTRMPIRLAGDAGRFRRLDILVRRTTGV